MANLTKEQINLYTVIGSAVLLVIWLLIPSISMKVFGFGDSFTMVRCLSDLGIVMTLMIILLFLCPLYILLYSYKEKMPALKPIFVLDRKIAGFVLAGLALLFIILLFVFKVEVGFGGSIPLSPAFGAWLYLIIAGGICWLGMEAEKVK